MNRNTTKVRGFGHNYKDQDHLDQLGREALAWLHFARGRATLSTHHLQCKMVEGVMFSLRHRLNNFALPTKLRGVSRGGCQQTLMALHELDLAFGDRLLLETEEEGIHAYFGEDKCGELAGKYHWMQPLVPLGMTLHLIAITGTEREEGWLGANVALGHVGLAALRFQQQSRGDGQAAGLPEPAGDQTGDIVLWRDAGGTAHTNIRHFVRHSPTGIEWQSTGAGGHDLAYSMLRLITTHEEAKRHTFALKHEVVALIPYEGKRLSLGFIRRWLSEKRLAV